MQKTNQQGYRLYLYCIGYKCVPSFNANCFTGFAHTGNNAGKTRFRYYCRCGCDRCDNSCIKTALQPIAIMNYRKGLRFITTICSLMFTAFRILGIEKNQIPRCRMPVFRKFRSARVSDRRNLYSIQKTMVGLIWAVPESAIYGSQQRFMRKKYSYSMWTIQRRL